LSLSHPLSTDVEGRLDTARKETGRKLKKISGTGMIFKNALRALRSIQKESL